MNLKSDFCQLHPFACYFVSPLQSQGLPGFRVSGSAVSLPLPGTPPVLRASVSLGAPSCGRHVCVRLRASPPSPVSCLRLLKCSGD